MKRKILFIYPSTVNYPVIPAGISILLGIAKKLSWKTNFFDTFVYKKGIDNWTDNEKSGEFKTSDITASIKHKSLDTLKQDLQETIDGFKPSIIAISCISYEYEFFLQFFQDIKISEGTIVVIGGIHATLEPDAVLKSGLFDLVCIGEGEEAFTEILTKYERGDDLSKIGNICYYDKKTGTVIRNARRQYMPESMLWEYDLDRSFGEEYFKYPFDGKIYKRVAFEIARGCPYNCNYCGNSALMGANKGLGRFVRVRPMRSIKEGLTELVKKFGIEFINLRDECFLSHPVKWLKEFCDWYGKEIRKPFIVQSRPEIVTEERISHLKKMNAPFFQVSMGVESGSKRILYKVLNRKTKIEKIIKTFDLLNYHKIRTCAFFMIGLPYETREDIFKSIDLCRRINPTIGIVSIFQPLPGQQLRDVCLREGFITENDTTMAFTTGSILRMPQISAEEISNLRRVFLLYAKLPEEYYSQIEKCERDYSGNRELHEKLVNLRWK